MQPPEPTPNHQSCPSVSVDLVLEGGWVGTGRPLELTAQSVQITSGSGFMGDLVSKIKKKEREGERERRKK